MSDEAAPASTVSRRWHVLGFVVFTAAGFYAIGVALQLGLWRQNSPGEGLFPFIAAVAMTAFAVAGLVSAWRMPRRSAAAANRGDLAQTLIRVAAYIFGLVFYALALNPLGFITSTIVTVVFILRFAERYSWPVTLALAVGTAAGCQILFVIWLGAILPFGYLWESLLY